MKNIFLKRYKTQKTFTFKPLKRKVKSFYKPVIFDFGFANFHDPKEKKYYYINYSKLYFNTFLTDIFKLTISLLSGVKRNKILDKNEKSRILSSLYDLVSLVTTYSFDDLVNQDNKNKKLKTVFFKTFLPLENEKEIIISFLKNFFYKEEELKLIL